MAQDILQTFHENDAATDTAFFRALFRLMQVPLEHCIPAIVKEISGDNVTVLPLAKNVQMTSEGTKSVDRGLVTVRRLRIAHGGFLFSTPIFVGDTGWIIAGDRPCMDAKGQNSTILTESQNEDYSPNKGPSEPDDYSLGAFKNGLFIPDSWGNIADYIENGDMDRLVISNIEKDDKSAKITLGKDGKILIQCGTQFTLQEGDKVAQLRPTIVKNQFGKSIKVFVLRTDTDKEEPDPDPPGPGPDIGDYVQHINGLKDDITIVGENNINVITEEQKIIVRGPRDIVNRINGIAGYPNVVGGDGVDVTTNGSDIIVSLSKEDKEKERKNCNEWSGEYDNIDNSFTEPDNSWSDPDNEEDEDGSSGGIEEGQAWSIDDCRAVNNDFK